MNFIKLHRCSRTQQTAIPPPSQADTISMKLVTSIKQVFHTARDATCRFYFRHLLWTINIRTYILLIKATKVFTRPNSIKVSFAPSLFKEKLIHSRWQPVNDDPQAGGWREEEEAEWGRCVGMRCWSVEKQWCVQLFSCEGWCRRRSVFQCRCPELGTSLTAAKKIRHG